MAAAFGWEPVFTDADLRDLRVAVRTAMRSAREAGCNIDDLVWPNDRDSVCQGCPVAPQCGHHGADEKHGVWGGLATFRWGKGRRRAG